MKENTQLTGSYSIGTNYLRTLVLSMKSEKWSKFHRTFADTFPDLPLSVVIDIADDKYNWDIRDGRLLLTVKKKIEVSTND